MISLKIRFKSLIKIIPILLGGLFGVVYWEPAAFDYAVLIIFLAWTLIRPGQIFFSGGLINALILLFLLAQLPAIIFYWDYLNYRYLAITVYLLMLGKFTAVFYEYYPDYFIAFLRSFVVFAAIFALFSSLDFATKGSLLNNQFVWMGSRAVGLFKDPNVFGSYLVPAFFLCLTVPLMSGPSGYVLRILCSLLIGLGIILAGSRGAWVNTIVCIVCWLGASSSKRYFKLSKPFAVTCVVATIGVLLVLMWAITTRDNLPLESYLTDRVRYHSYDDGRFGNQLRLLGLTDYFLFGVGPGRLEEFTDEFASHNTYLRVLVEHGIIAFCVFTIMILLAAVPWRFFVKDSTKNLNDDQKIGWIMRICLAGVLVNSLVIDTLHWRHFWVVLMVSLVDNLRRHKKRTNLIGV